MKYPVLVKAHCIGWCIYIYFSRYLLQHRPSKQPAFAMNVDIMAPFNRLNLNGNAKVTALHFQDEKLFIGFSNGDITIMKVSDNPESLKTPARSMRSFRSFTDIKGLFHDNDLSLWYNTEKTFKNVNGSLAAITALRLIPLYKDGSRDVLLIGSSDTLQAFEWVGAHLNLINSFLDSKSFNQFRYVETKDRRLILIGCKKRLHVYQIKQKSRNIFDFILIKELNLKDKLRAIGGHKNHDIVVLGMTNSFAYLELDEPYQLKDLPTEHSGINNLSQSTSFSYFGISSTGPQIWVVDMKNSTSLVIRDSQVGTLTFQEKSCSLKSSNVNFQAVPVDVAFLSPCYLLVLYNRKLEIIDVASGAVVQVFHHHMNNSNISLTVNEDVVIIGAGTNVFQFRVHPIRKQLNQFLSIRGSSSGARGLKELHHDLRLIGLERALTLVSNLDNDDSLFFPLGLFEAATDKHKLLYLRNLYLEKALVLFELYGKYHEALINIGSEWILSYKEVLKLFPDFLNGEYQSAQLKEGDTEGSEESKSSGFVNPVRRVSVQEVDAIKQDLINNTPPTNGDQAPVEGQASHSPSVAPSINLEELKSLKIRKFNKAVGDLIVFMTDQRRIYSIFLGSSDMMPTLPWKGVEITPLDFDQSLKEEDMWDRIKSDAAYIDTTLFLCYFYTKPMLLGPLLRLPNNKCDSKVVNHYLLKDLHSHTKESQVFIRELLDFYYGRGLHEEALSMLYKLAHDESSHSHEYDEYFRSPDLTITYFQKLDNSHLDLICEYAKWVLLDDDQKMIERAASTFMNETYECESYDTTKIFEFFKSSIKNDDLAIRYLEWLLNESDVLQSSGRARQRSTFSTKLCLFYLKKLKALECTDEEFFENEVYKKLFGFLKESSDYEPWTVLKNIPTSQDKFLRFTIFIYKRLGEHQKSVDVLFNQLSDLDGAIDYCSELYDNDERQAGTDLLHKLLEDLLLHYEENIDSITKLLTTQGTKMSMTKTLLTLPSAFPLQKLDSFLSDNLVITENDLQEKMISAQLYKVGAVKVQYDLQKERSRFYKIPSKDEECDTCHQSIGKNVICIDPKDEISHYKCYQNNRE